MPPNHDCNEVKVDKNVAQDCTSLIHLYKHMELQSLIANHHVEFLNFYSNKAISFSYPPPCGFLTKWAQRCLDAGLRNDLKKPLFCVQK